MSRFLQSLVLAGKVPFLVDYRTGSAQSLSGMVAGTVPTITGTPRFTQSKLGRAINFTTGLLTYPHQADQLSLSHTIMALGEFTETVASTQYIASKRQGGIGQDWMLSLSSTKVFSYDASATVSSNGLPIVRSISWAHVSGTQSLAYQNGNSATTNVLVTTIPQFPASISVGGYAAASYLQSPLYSVVMVNEALSPADIARLHRELTDAPGIVSRPRKAFSIPYPVKTPAEYAAEGIILDLAPKVVGGKMRDLSGNGYDSSNVVGSYDQSEGGPFDSGVRLQEGSYAQLNASLNSIMFRRSYTVTAWLKPALLSASNGIVFGGWIQHFIGRNTNRIAMQYSTSAAGVVSLNGPIGLRVGEWTHASYTLSTGGGSTTIKLFQNGVEVASKTDPVSLWAGATGNVWFNTLSSAFLFGFFGTFGQVTYYDNRVLTPAEIREEYLKGARKCLLDARVHSDGSCPVSLAAVGAQGSIANGWTVQSGTWKVVEDAPTAPGVAGRRWLKSQSAGTVSTPGPKQAYGSWHDRIRFNGVEHEWLFVATNESSVSAASQNGYGIHVSAAGAVTIRERTAGVASTLLATGAALAIGQSYDRWIERRFDGLIRFWIRGGVWTDWTLLGSVTDTTTTTSGYQIHYAAAANGETGGDLQYLG